MPRSSTLEIQRFCDQFLSDSLLKTVSDRRPWPKLEDIIGEIYFGLASYFSPPDYDRVPSLDFSPAIPRDPRESEAIGIVQYLAVNFRGLYQRNGRETILGPMGKLRASQPDLAVHRCVHECYMQLLSRKAWSINQLFLANTTLDSISILFKGDSASRLACKECKSEIQVGADLFSLWQGFLPRWQSVTRKFLKNPKLHLPKFQQSLIDGRQEVIAQVRSHTVKLLGTDFFNQWCNIPHNPSLGDAVEAVERYQQWLLSLSWLCFHCNPQHAGRYFYSVRLPSLLDGKYGAHVAIPESSISLVCKSELPERSMNSFNSFPQSLHKNPRFEMLRRIVSEAFVVFETERHQRDRIGEEGNLARFISPSASKSPLLTADYRKVDFLLRMARLLVGQRHEGHPLHFCFVFGFSSERIDSESKGVLTEVVSELQDQWQRFEKGTVERSVEGKLRTRTRRGKADIASMLDGQARDQILALFADGMAKWIKTGDLPLQSWNTALFFEEVENKAWPIPTSLVRISSRGIPGDDSIATEFQLRRALKNLTAQSQSSVAILVGESGLILFARGKAILIPAAIGTSYEIPFSSIRLWGDRVDSDKFKDFLLERTARGSFSKVGQTAREYACQIVVDLCEALVTLGHGALIAIGIGNGKRRPLPPLNPVWVVEPGKTAPSLGDGLLLYAYMSALDGATEIVLPMGEGPVSFSVRKSVLPNRKIWMYDRSGDSVLSPEFRDVIDALGLVGKGTRHHSALALSADLKGEGIVLTVSADGPVTVWQEGKKASPDDAPDYQPRFRP